MAATTRVREFLWLVGEQLGDLKPQFGFWPERELVSHTMAGESAIVTFLPMAVSRVDAIKLRPGTRQDFAVVQPGDCKPGNGSTPSQPIHYRQILNPRRNMGANGTTPGPAIRLVERDQKDLATPDWHSRTGTPVREVIYDPMTPRECYVWPGVPAGATWWAEFALTAAPQEIPNTGAPGSELYAWTGSNTTTLSVDDEYRDMLLHYVVARALLKETKAAERGKYAVHENLFLSQLNAKVALVTGTNPNLTTLPGVNPAPQG